MERISEPMSYPASVGMPLSIPLNGVCSARRTSAPTQRVYGVVILQHRSITSFLCVKTQPNDSIQPIFAVCATPVTVDEPPVIRMDGVDRKVPRLT